MNSNPTLFRILALAVLLLTRLLAQAAEPTSAITYQGKLVQNDEPVDGFVDLVFRLYDSPEAGTQIGNAFSVSSIGVTDGVFTAQLDFGTAVFDGADRWLEIAVNGVTLSPRQPITPAPMAHFAHRADTSRLATSALSAETAATSEFAETAGEIPGSAMFDQDGDAAVYLGSLRLGEFGNSSSLQLEGQFASGRNSTAAASYSFIGGGDDNRTTGIDSFIGGGADNRGFGNGSAISGGLSNATNSPYSAISGGHANETGADYSFVGGGVANKTEGDYSAVSGGRSNIASGLNSFVGGGHGNDAEGENSMVAGGWGNTSSGRRSFVGGGALNIASGFNSFIGGGALNRAEGSSSFASGFRAGALHHGSFVWADQTDEVFSTTAENQFLIRANGGVGIGTAPARDLHLLQSDGETVLPGIQLESSEHVWAFYIDDTGDLVFEADGETVIRINTTGINTVATVEPERQDSQDYTRATDEKIRELEGRLNALEQLLRAN